MEHEIFTDEEKKLLDRIGTSMTFRPGSMICFEGDPADAVYYIRKGRVRVFRNLSSGREVTLDVVEAGHMIGESAFASDSRRNASVQAVNTVQIVNCKMTRLLPYLRQEPTLALHFLQQCSDTMDRLANRFHDQCLLDRYGKVASLILDLTASDSVEKGTVGGALPYTHENIAESLGLSRTTVTGVLRWFGTQGWVQSGYGRIRVLDREALEQFVAEQKKA